MEIQKNYTVTITDTTNRDVNESDIYPEVLDDLVYRPRQPKDCAEQKSLAVDKDRVIAFIPVRGGSKSIPLKNIKNFCGKPLVYWVIEELQKCEEVTDIVVATDSDEIEECVGKLEDLTKVSVFRRSQEVSTDTASTESVILEYLGSSDYDLRFKDTLNPVFMLVQATSPFTTSEDFHGGLKLFFSKYPCSVVSGVRTKRFHWVSIGSVYLADYNVYNRPRRQDFEGSIIENGAFYISSVLRIVNDQCRISNPVQCYVMPKINTLEIDEPSDWEEMESLMLDKLRLTSVWKKPKAVFLDVDGVLTDGTELWSDCTTLKAFHKRDGAAISTFNERGIPVFFITADHSRPAQYRSEYLGATYLEIDKSKGETKLGKALEYYSIQDLKECVFIGDDLFDMDLLGAVGYAFCPNDAHEDVKLMKNVIKLKTDGGRGVVSEVLRYFREDNN